MDFKAAGTRKASSEVAGRWGGKRTKGSLLRGSAINAHRAVGPAPFENRGGQTDSFAEKGAIAEKDGFIEAEKDGFIEKDAIEKDGLEKDAIEKDAFAEKSEEHRADSVDDDLVTRVLGGEEDAFELLVRRHSPRVFNIIGSFFRRRDIVEDIAQEVFTKSYFSLSSYTLGRSFEAWLARIAVNTCYDQLRAQKRRNEQPLPHKTEREDEWLELQMLEVARDRHASQQRQSEAVDIAERLLARLSPEDRLVVVLMDRDGFSVREIAEMTGWGLSKVKVRAFRARRALRGAMKRLLMAAERKQKTGR